MAMPRVHEVLLRRWAQLHNRVDYMESVFGTDSELAEKAVRALIDFEVDAGNALGAALAASPARAVRTRVSEEDFQDD